jgi:transcription antitermination factor NusG
MKNWYAINVRPRTEKTISKRLTQKGIDHYLPLKKTLKQWSDRKKWVEIPAISGYIFVNINPLDKLSVLQTEFVHNFVSFNDSDAIIPEVQIRAMKTMAEQAQFEDDINIKNLILNQSVKIVSGPLAGLEGKLISIKNRKKVVVNIEQINISFSIELPPGDIKTIS